MLLERDRDGYQILDPDRIRWGHKLSRIFDRDLMVFEQMHENMQIVLTLHYKYGAIRHVYRTSI